MRLRDFPLSNGDKQFLEYRITTRSLPQTILLEGGSAEVRRQLATFLAEALVCTGAQERPCGTCRACVKSKADSHPDIQFFAPEKKNGVFKVELCREIRQDAFVMANDGDNKVYVLEDCQTMNDSSENALLKILEEPPAGVYFLLTCDSRAAMLPTILSRATVLSVAGDGLPFSEETLHTAAEIALAVGAPSEISLLEKTAVLEKNREEICNVLQCLAELFAAALRVKSGAPQQAVDKASQALAAQFTKAKLYALWQATCSLCADAEYNANTNLLLTGICYQLRRAAETKL